MIRQILPNNNEKCYRNFSPKFFASKHGPRLGEHRRMSVDRLYHHRSVHCLVLLPLEF
jgi:hypothetical protein